MTTTAAGTVPLAVFHVSRDEGVGYDETAGYVAVAQDEQHARTLGSDVPGDQSSTVWFAPTTTVTRIGSADLGESGIVLTDYNAG
jgi:hypothetical protein